MKVEIEAPSAMEAAIAEDSATRIEHEPLVPRNQSILRVGHVKVTGDGGKVAQGIIMFNGKKGEFSIKQIVDSQVTLDFDLPEKGKTNPPPAPVQQPTPSTITSTGTLDHEDKDVH